MKDQDLIAAFMAGRAPTTCPEGVAYGVDKEADKAKRHAFRQARRYEYPERTEQDFERQAEAISEAYHTGGRHAAIDALNASNGWL